MPEIVSGDSWAIIRQKINAVLNNIGPLYLTPADGLAATTEGQTFQVQTASGDTSAAWYRHDAGPVATLIGEFPTVDYMEDFLAQLLAASGSMEDIGTVADNIALIEQAAGSVMSVQPSLYTSTAGMTQITLAAVPSASSSVFLFIGGSIQFAEIDFTVDGSTLTFASPIEEAGLDIIAITVSGVSFEEVEALRDAAEAAAASIRALGNESREDLVALIGGGFAYEVGAIVSDGRVLYRSIPAVHTLYGILPGLPSLIPFNVWDVAHFGARYDEDVDNTAAMNAALVAAKAAGEKVVNATAGRSLRWDGQVVPTDDYLTINFGFTFCMGQNFDDWAGDPGALFPGSRYGAMITARGTEKSTTTLSAEMPVNSRTVPVSSTANISVGDCLQVSTGEIWYSTGGFSSQSFNGTGSTTVFTLSKAVIYEDNFEVWTGGYELETFDGNGSTTVFTLAQSVSDPDDFDVWVGGVKLEGGGVDYTVSGTTLTFTTAPASGTDNIEARHLIASAMIDPADYTVSGTTLTMDTAPIEAVGNLIARHYDFVERIDRGRVLAVDTENSTVLLDAQLRFPFGTALGSEVFVWTPVRGLRVIGGNWRGPGADHDGYTNGFGPAAIGVIGAVDFVVRPVSIHGFPARAAGINYCIDGLFECYDIEGLPADFIDPNPVIDTNPADGEPDEGTSGGTSTPVEGGGYSGYYSTFVGRSSRITFRVGAIKRCRHGPDGSESHDCRVVGARPVYCHRSALTVHEGCDNWLIESYLSRSAVHYGGQWRGGSVRIVDGEFYADGDDADLHSGNEYGLTFLGGRASDLERVFELINPRISAWIAAIYQDTHNARMIIKNPQLSKRAASGPCILVGGSYGSVPEFDCSGGGYIDAGGGGQCIQFAAQSLKNGDRIKVNDIAMKNVSDVPIRIYSPANGVQVVAQHNQLDDDQKVMLRYPARATGSTGPVFDVRSNYSGPDVIYGEETLGAEAGPTVIGPFTPTIIVGGVELEAGGGSYSSQTGRYQITGTDVTAAIEVGISNLNGLTGAIRIGNLPIAGISVMSQNVPDIGYSGMPSGWGDTDMRGRVRYAANYIELRKPDGAGNYNINLDASDIQNGTFFRAVAKYVSNT